MILKQTEQFQKLHKTMFNQCLEVNHIMIDENRNVTKGKVFRCKLQATSVIVCLWWQNLSLIHLTHNITELDVPNM